MGKLVSSAVLLLIAFSLLLAAATLRSQRPGPVVNLLRLAGYVVAAIALVVGAGSLLAVIDPGEVGVRHAFGYTDPAPLLAGIRYVPPWSSIERYSTRAEQWPTRGEQIEAINNKIAQEQQIETERHRVEVARLQTEQQRLLNQTLSPEALTKQWIEVLHDMRSSNNLIIFVPTEGGLPLLNIGDLRKNL